MIIPEGYGQINLLFTGPGLPNGAQVTWGIDNRTLDLTPLQIGQVILDAYNTANFDALMTTAANLTGILVKLGPEDTGPSIVFSCSVPGINSDPASAAVAHLAHKHTAFGGRRGRGRAFWPAVRESQVDGGGAILSATVTLWNTALFTFHAELATEGIPMVVLHGPPTHWEIVDGQPKRVNDSSAGVPAPYEMSGWTLDPMVATQRRRQRG